MDPTQPGTASVPVVTEAESPRKVDRGPVDQTTAPIDSRGNATLWNQVKLRLLLAGVDADEVDRLDTARSLGATDGADVGGLSGIPDGPSEPIEVLRSQVLWGDEAPITIEELAHRSGIKVDVCRRARMLLGLPDPGDEAVCRVQEVDAFRSFAAGMALYGEEPTMHFTRVLGSALASIAEGSLSVFGRALTDLADEESQVPQGDAYTLLVFDAIESFQLVPTVMQVATKLLFDQAVRRLTGDPGAARMFAVGFVDLTDSTTATERLGNDTMAAALTRFEEWSAQLAVSNGGRVIKYIGDEVMYLAPDLLAAAEVAESLLQRISDDPVLRSARGGIAYGEVLSRDGDWFGTTVNMASRLVDKARPNTILLTGEGAGDCEHAVHKGKRRLRDISERVDVWRIG